MIQLYEDQVKSEFICDRTSVNDAPISGRPKSATASGIIAKCMLWCYTTDGERIFK